MQALLIKAGITSVYVTCSNAETENTLRTIVHSAAPGCVFKSLTGVPYTCDYQDLTKPNGLKKAKSKMNGLRVRAEEDDPINMTNTHLYIVVHTELRKSTDGNYKLDEHIVIQNRHWGGSTHRIRPMQHAVYDDTQVTEFKDTFGRLISAILEKASTTSSTT
jgi:hypothetical protein